ncbi:oxygenase MpaB family protein [Streptomyces sp. NPDC048416]|uniref:oxygenase MpaB family protein n=1 Tax=Streptomyces sp. NPDC048416 TaxID=3365546 RepID=UPI0037244668
MLVDAMRTRLGSALFSRVAGPDGPANRARIHDTPGPRWFALDSPVRAVHGDAAMFIGGIAALLLQSLHPLAMAAVAGHSGYKGDPWGRLQRTSTFLAVTTFGTEEHAQHAVDQVRAVHARIRGTAPDGRAYRADDPHLLTWVYTAEAYCFLAAHQRFGAHPLDEEGRDRYVAEAARVARALGADDAPSDLSTLRRRLDAYRPELRATRDARAAARFLLLTPPLPWAARPAYGVLAANAVGLLPGWARHALLLPYVPVVEETFIRAGGHGLTRTIRWAMRPPA